MALVRWAGVLSKVLGSYRHKLRGYTIAWRPLHQLIRQQCIAPPTEYIGALSCRACSSIKTAESWHLPSVQCFLSDLNMAV